MTAFGRDPGNVPRNLAPDFEQEQERLLEHRVQEAQRAKAARPRRS